MSGCAAAGGGGADPTVLTRKGEGIKLSDDGREATKTEDTRSYTAAASKAVMRSGRHRARFTVAKMRGNQLYGVIRATWNVEAKRAPETVAGHSLYRTNSGRRMPGDEEWKGRQSANTEGDTITMELDLDAGTMTVWKNDERLDVMATGLSGEYSWAIMLWGDYSDSVRIESAAVPAPAANNSDSDSE